jgi:hypothetical protein
MLPALSSRVAWVLQQIESCFIETLAEVSRKPSCHRVFCHKPRVACGFEGDEKRFSPPSVFFEASESTARARF